jgi:hypothetical protein
MVFSAKYGAQNVFELYRKSRESAICGTPNSACTLL